MVAGVALHHKQASDVRSDPEARTDELGGGSGSQQPLVFANMLFAWPTMLAKERSPTGLFAG